MRGNNGIVAVVLAVMLLSACSKRLPLLPTSGGRPYDVLLVGDRDSVVTPMLTQDTPGLPQPEPLFSVSSISSDGLEGSQKLARSIILVQTDSSNFSHMDVSYERNVFAQPQMVLYITAPSAQAIAEGLRPETLQKMLLNHEMGISISQLRRKHNKKLTERVRRMFGAEMLIPRTMKKVRQSDGFLWMSDNRPDRSTNICIYTSENRDSVMKVNIKGETDSIYMATVKGSTLQNTLKKGKQTVIVRRGLWQMEGDAMGGPWVSHTMEDARTGRVVVAEAFVYAPGHDKRNLMFEAEAALMTLQPASTTTKKRK